MKKRTLILVLFLVMLAAVTGIARAASLASADKPALVFVEATGPNDTTRFVSTGLPVYAVLDGGLLTGADQSGRQALDKAGLRNRVLDPDLQAGSYYLAQSWTSRPAPDYATYGRVLLHLGNSIILRMDPSRVDALTQAGAELSAITLTPKALPAAGSADVFPAVVEPDPIVQSIIDQVTTTQVYTYDRQLAGELPVWVDGNWYTITTRNTYSGVPIQKTTSFVGQHMANDLGMSVDYYQWNDATNPDVIGEITGLINPEDIFIIGAHIDDVNGAPGADDNGSGSVATLIAADILSQYQWGCTMRFGFWTGEEQGLLGSDAYAQHIHDEGQNVVGYLNLDMIAWNTINSDPTIYLGYRASVPPSLDLANLFADVITAYNIDLLPTIGTSYDGSSDHTSFLNQGYPAILGIEGNDDFNPYYHSGQDTPAHTDPVFFTNFVKAALASDVHMSNCLIPAGIGSLDGHVTDADYGVPVAGAKITADDGAGHHISTTTDASGFYTRTLLANTYSVTADAAGYAPETVDNIVVTTDTVTTQDFVIKYIPNVAFAPDAQVQAGHPGTQVSYVYTVTNDAHVEQEIQLNLVSKWPAEAPTTTGLLPPEASVTIPVTVTIPMIPDVIIGTDTFTMTAVGSVGGIAVATGTTNANVTPGVQVTAPQDGTGIPEQVISYQFVVTNTGDYTDTFTLYGFGIWPTSLPGGNKTGPLAPGEVATVTVEVTVPPDVKNGAQCITTFRATSGLSQSVRDSDHVTSTAVVIPPVYYTMMPLIRR